VTYSHAPGLGIRLAQMAERASVPGHQLTLVPEDPPELHNATTYGTVVHTAELEDGVGNPVVVEALTEIRGEWPNPWIRATCSCGWSATRRDRFTIEENAIHHWRTHHLNPTLATEATPT